MAQRQQPLRACKYPPPDCDIETGLEAESSQAAESRYRMIAMKKQRRIRSKPAEIDEELWKDLHPELVENVLSHLPVCMLWQTVMAINPARWKQILADGNILGHVNHVDSTIGLIKSYSTPCRVSMSGDDVRPPALRAFEHTTGTWQSLPRLNPTANNIHHGMRVLSVSEGLILMAMVEGLLYRLAAWNPISGAHRWLPVSSIPIIKPKFFLCKEVLAVDREKSRGYKVVRLFDSVDTVLPNLNAHSVRRHINIGDYRTVSGYTIYDSNSSAWSAAVQLPPKDLGEMRIIKSCVVSGDGFVFLLSVKRRVAGLLEAPRGIVCYDASVDSWKQVLFPPRFFGDLPGIQIPGFISKKLFYASGKIYILVLASSEETGYSYYMASIALADILSGVPAFEHIGRLVRSKPRPQGRYQSPHPAPRGGPQELTLHPECGAQCEHQWYMLPVESRWHLCAMFCGRWLKRFDLHARVWMDSMLLVPTDHENDQAVRAAVTPPGARQLRMTKFHPYVPSWIVP